MANRVNFTKRFLDDLSLPEGQKRAYHYDSKVNGLGVSVTPKGVKSFLVYKKLNGRPVRVTLGHYPDLSVEQARKRAQKAIVDLIDGKNPISEKKAQKNLTVTLAQCFKDYLIARKSLKPGTVHDYKRIMKEVFPDWQDMPLKNITREKVVARHHKYGKQSEARANNAMRVLRALFNFAKGEYEDAEGNTLYPDNPVNRISHTKAWYRVERRQTMIPVHSLPLWFQAVNELAGSDSVGEGETARDYLLLLLFTGLRRSEAFTLKWEQVDLEGKTLTILDTKNRQNHILPLTSFLMAMLQKRKTLAINSYIFGSHTSKTGHIVNVHKQIAKIVNATGIAFSAHDLRRTFVTIAESLDIPAYALKRLLNHKTKGDVTAGYIIMDVERLRKPMQKITDYILKASKYEKSGEVVQLSKNN